VGHGQQRRDRDASGDDDVAPVEVDERGLGEEIEILDKVLGGFHRSVLSGLLALLLPQRHEILVLRFLRLGCKVAGMDLEVILMALEDGSSIDERVGQGGVLAVLGIELPQRAFILDIRLQSRVDGLGLCKMRNQAGKRHRDSG
jgi:hypothetical protein